MRGLPVEYGHNVCKDAHAIELMSGQSVGSGSYLSGLIACSATYFLSSAIVPASMAAAYLLLMASRSCDAAD